MKNLRTYRVVVRIVEIFYYELDPQILSAANSILRPLKIECSRFDPIFLRDSALFSDTFMHVYVRTTDRASDLIAILRYNHR